VYHCLRRHSGGEPTHRILPNRDQSLIVVTFGLSDDDLGCVFCRNSLYYQCAKHWQWHGERAAWECFPHMDELIRCNAGAEHRGTSGNFVSGGFVAEGLSGSSQICGDEANSGEDALFIRTFAHAFERFIN
jgi:hypothetical protein